MQLRNNHINYSQSHHLYINQKIALFQHRKWYLNIEKTIIFCWYLKPNTPMAPSILRPLNKPPIMRDIAGECLNGL